MDYFKQRRAYRNFKLMEASVSNGQNNLYRELLDYANDEGKLDAPFPVKNSALISLTGLSIQGLEKARNQLVQLGLIGYVPGKRNKSVPQYQIINLYATSSATSKQRSVTTSSLEVSQPVAQVVAQPVAQVVAQQVAHKDLTSTNQDQLKPEESAEPKKTQHRAKTRKRVYDPESSPYKLAVYLFDKIKANNPDAKQPNLQTWSDDARKLLELDKQDKHLIWSVIDWCQADSFWSGNILSVAKLRQKFGQLVIQMKNSKLPKYNKQQPLQKETLPDWAQPDYKYEREGSTPEEEAEAKAALAALKKHKEEYRNAHKSLF